MTASDSHNKFQLLGAVMPLSTIQIISWGTIYFSFPLFIEPMRQDLHWSQSTIAAGISIGLMVSAVAQLFIGRFIDRVGAPAAMCVGALLGAASMLLLSTNTSIIGYYIAWTVLGLTITLCFFEPAFAVLLDQIPDQFERSVSYLVFWSGLSSAIFLPLTHWLILRAGWRETLFIFSAFHVVSALVSLHPLRARQRRIASDDLPALPGPNRDSRKEPQRIPFGKFRELRFWCLAAGFALNTCVITTLVIHLQGILTARHFSTVTVISAIALIGPLQMAGRLVQAVLASRISYRSLTIAACLTLLGGVLCLQAAMPSGSLIWISVALIGIGSGIMTTLRGTIVAILFEHNVYARVSNVIAAPSSLARAASPVGASLIAATAIGYGGLGWIICIAAAIAVIAIFYSLTAYR